MRSTGATFRSLGGLYLRGQDGRPIVALTCPNCRLTIHVDADWRRLHIGETVPCWDCRRWADIPVLAEWERN